jgi:arsenical pump membrane protein
MLVLFHLLSWQVAVAAVGSGTDVYLFLVGMMLLSEVARKQGLFNWLATQAVTRARGSAKRLFLIIYVVGTLVTVFLSNDATAGDDASGLCSVQGRAGRATPISLHLRIHRQRREFCPSNCQSCQPRRVRRADAGSLGMAALFCRAVLYCDPGDIRRIAADATAALEAKVTAIKGAPPLTFGGKLAAVGIAFTGVVLLSASAFGRPLGLPTFCAGASLTAIVLVIARQSPLPILENVSWSVRPLVAGLFVLVAGVNQTGVAPALARNLHNAAVASPLVTSWVAGFLQPRQQSADGSDRGGHKSCRAGARARVRRDPDRRRSRA